MADTVGDAAFARELIAIARAISTERDITRLLGLILEKCRRVTGADAGSVYIVEGREGEDRNLHFMVSQNDSLAIDFREFRLPIDGKSIVGKTVLSRQVINIENLYDLERADKNPWGFVHDRTFDQKTGYQGRSMLTVPMTNQRDEVIGVIQLINKRKSDAPALVAPDDFEKWVVPFDAISEERAATLAAQAGISLENTLLYEEIRNLFEGFVQASVTAIESRDPTTSGHSYRVATLTVKLAEAIDRDSSPAHRATHFTIDDLKEIEYAALLHDFGKVGVREKVLVKAKKLYDYDLELVKQRLQYVRKSIEHEFLQKNLTSLLAAKNVPSASWLAGVEAEKGQALADFDQLLAAVLSANEPTVLPEGSFEHLQAIAARTYRDASGADRPYLTPDELTALQIRRGSLTEDERKEIESHVVHTFQFLQTIPWGRRFGRIPSIAGSHHEKLDGTGYPRGLQASEIRVETRMMTIADIFDALTARDRPYKRAVPTEKALDIIADEVKRGKLDADLFKVFVDSRTWQWVARSS